MQLRTSPHAVSAMGQERTKSPISLNLCSKPNADDWSAGRFNHTIRGRASLQNMPQVAGHHDDPVRPRVTRMSVVRGCCQAELKVIRNLFMRAHGFRLIHPIRAAQADDVIAAMPPHQIQGERR